MDTQAKLQNVALVKEISDIQEEVSTKTKRVLKRQISLKKEKDSVKRARREEKRQTELTKREEGSTETITSGRVLVKNNYSNRT
jgi:hypothetical protein